MLTGKCKEDFIKWASNRHPFNFNKHTKKLTFLGRSFFDILPAIQVSPIVEFADSVGVILEMQAYIDSFGFMCFANDLNYIAEGLIKPSRFEANIDFINFFNKYYNEKNS